MLWGFAFSISHACKPSETAETARKKWGGKPSSVLNVAYYDSKRLLISKQELMYSFAGQEKVKKKKEQLDPPYVTMFYCQNVKKAEDLAYEVESFQYKTSWGGTQTTQKDNTNAN